MEFSYLFRVHLFIGGVYQYVVEVARSKVVNEALYTDVEISLDCSWCVSPPERHDLVFKLTVPGAKLSFVLIIVLSWDEVIGSPKVQFREDQSSAQPVKHH